MSKRPGDPGYAAGWCIHYLGLSDGKGGWRTACEAGVNYDKFRGMSHDAQPCFLNSKGESQSGAIACEHLRRPTTEEIALHEKWANSRFDSLAVVLKAIRPWRESMRGKGGYQKIECPVCKGQLHLRISGSNGHVHGSCETENCVSWME